MDSGGLVDIGLYGTRFILRVGGAELFIVKRVDLQRQHIRLQHWDNAYAGACDFKAFDKPWFKPEDFGIIARNGCLAKIRTVWTRQELINVFASDMEPPVEKPPFLTEAFGRPAYIVDDTHAAILSGSPPRPVYTALKRNYGLTLEQICVSKYGYIIHPSIPELLKVLERHAGVLCDPFAIQTNAKKQGAKFVHVPLV
jgi:hypothetical protein